MGWKLPESFSSGSFHPSLFPQTGGFFMKTRKLTWMALSIALAMVMSFIESQIPSFVPIPGVKMGLANIVVVFALYRFGWKEALGISMLRVILVSLLFGHLASFFYSFAGALLSFAGMVLLKHSGRFGHVAVSVTGGVLHNIGQIAMACILLGTNAIAYYLPFLILSGTIAGILIGLVAAMLVKRIPAD